MMFGKMWFLKNLLLCVMVGQVTAERTSQRINLTTSREAPGDSPETTKTEAIMFEVFNGKYDNSAERLGPNSTDDFLQITVCPVVVQAISSKPLLACLEALNGIIIRAQLRSVEERLPRIITMETYTITRPDVYKGSTEDFNRTEIENLRADEIEHTEGCTARFHFEKDHFIGGVENCKDTVNGKHTLYGATMFCEEISVIMPVVAPEKSSLVPYDLVLMSGKYPLIDPPENYTRFCDKKNAEDSQ